MTEYWGKFGTNLEVNKTEDIIKEAIKQLESRTYGIIKGKFTQIIYSRGLQSVQEVLRKILNPQIKYSDPQDMMAELKEIPDIDMENIDNIDNSYGQDIYSFEIYTDKYKFRILQVVNSIAFPVGVILDEGIARELCFTKPAMRIVSNEQMEEFLKKVLSTNKVTNVINQMLVLAEAENADKKITDFLLTKPSGATVPEIASGVDLSQRLTLNKLREMEEKSLVEEVNQNGQTVLWVLKKDTNTF